MSKALRTLLLIIGLLAAGPLVLAGCNPEPAGDGVKPGDESREPSAPADTAVEQCPENRNPDRRDTDADRIENACDTDDDGDTVRDAIDNCPLTANSGQADIERDGIGNACESAIPNDLDSDGVPDDTDNCPAIINPDQSDNMSWPDGGLGDACSGDVDVDGVWPPFDNCPIDSNPRQEDADGDGREMYCDRNWIDHDNDGHDSDVDTCRFTPDPGQEDTDGDGTGNACDDDDDDDRIPDAADNCPYTSNAGQSDEDGDGFGDACEIDADNDGITGVTDNCLVIYNPDQSDMDADGIGDVCDAVTDSDGDAVPDWDDNCPALANPVPLNVASQRDFDGDEKGDACDTDNDADGVENTADNCPWTPNAAQADSDRDGTGDVCDTEGVLSCGPGGDLMALDFEPGDVTGEPVNACTDCRYGALYSLWDGDPDNSAFVVVPDAQSRENPSGPGHVRLTAKTPVTAGSRAAFMVALPEQALTYETAIGLGIELLRNGAVVASRRLPLYDSGDGVRKMIAAETGETFDALRLVVGGGWPRGERVEVYAACIEYPD